jgi:hypothetical protein
MLHVCASDTAHDGEPANAALTEATNRPALVAGRAISGA